MTGNVSLKRVLPQVLNQVPRRTKLEEALGFEEIGVSGMFSAN